ncbi:histone H3.3 [Trichonephila clavipes]|uniref:Histone H3.3 n=1 Tax=Trichonephila clavipes TaxID=2585209 RepID=A0A8X7BLF7_TRICX|nr:histone H3.3 [Trichonephila clavipes]
MKFGDEVKEWLCFWSQFKRIHEHKYIELEDKFQYLIQCMSPGTRVKEIIDGYPPTAENYTKAIENLKARFGREELLVEYYVHELLTLVVKNATKSKLSITELYDKLESHLRSLESIGMISDKYSAMLFPIVESCIPEDI